MTFVKTSEFSKIAVGGSISYVSQEAWIQSTTLMNNILFGLPMDETRYYDILNVCQLNKDLDIFPAKDLTEIGERGINLSGGQKAKVSLARAIYSDHDILLLDDPLSAVDAHVASELFYSCFKSYLKGKTILLVTNNQLFLQHVDKIIVIHQGSIVEQGTYDQLVDQNGFFYNEYMVNNDFDDIRRVSKDEIEIEEEKPNVVNVKGSRLIEDERKETGKINLNVFKTYFRFGGGWLAVGLILGIMMV